LRLKPYTSAREGIRSNKRFTKLCNIRNNRCNLIGMKKGAEAPFFNGLELTI